MLKKVIFSVLSIMVVVSMLFATTPVFAIGSGGRQVVVKGVIDSVDVGASTITIAPNNGGANLTLSIDVSTVIHLQGKRATLANLYTSESIVATYNSKTMVAKQVDVHTSNVGAQGLVTSINIAAGTFSMTKGGLGVTLTLHVDSRTVIKRAGKTTSLSGLNIGDKVEVTYNPVNMLAYMVNARLNLVTMVGHLSAFDVANNSLTVTNDQTGKSITLHVDATTTIRRFGIPATLGDLKIGDLINARYNAVTFLANVIDARLY